MSQYTPYQSAFTGPEIDEKLRQLATIRDQIEQILSEIKRLGLSDSTQSSDIESLRQLLPKTIQFANYTQEEYDHAKAANTLEPKWYFIFQDYQYRRIMRIYYYGTLVGQRGDREVSTGFPYIFPIIF